MTTDKVWAEPFSPPPRLAAPVHEYFTGDKVNHGLVDFVFAKERGEALSLAASVTRVVMA